ncbi:MAG TPA: hypothetical protein VFC19_31120 [Candidatus Limnocylindrales bacterium]|nr:hypothetical protein [Candidatus Limnocylindrales bacterium]
MTQTNTKYPSAFYAAAGVGDLVYEQLRKLQTKAITFGNEQAPQWKRRIADFSANVDAGRVRETVVTGTQAAAEKATQVYGTLVARGTKAFAETSKTETPKAESPKAESPKAESPNAASPKAPMAAAPKADAPIAKKAATPRKKVA